jgi:hypothetical protein
VVLHCSNSGPKVIIEANYLPPRIEPMSVAGQKAKYSLRADVFRFTPESGLKSDIA